MQSPDGTIELRHQKPAKVSRVAEVAHQVMARDHDRTFLSPFPPV